MNQLLNRHTVTRGVVVIALLLVAIVVLPETLGGDWISTLTSVAIYSVVAAGLVVLYGKVGMISLGQIALLGLGTWVATRLNYLVELPFPVMLLATGAITCVVGVLIGLPRPPAQRPLSGADHADGRGSAHDHPAHDRVPERRAWILRPPLGGRPVESRGGAPPDVG